MIYIDKYAYISKLSGEDPALKFLFSSATLGVCLWADSIPISLFIVACMAWASVRKGGLPFRFYCKLMLLPMSFLIMGVLTIAVQVSARPEEFLLSYRLRGITVGATGIGLQTAAGLFFKALGAVSCLYFLSLTTPMIEMLSVLRKLKVPRLMVELMGLVYRFIFLLMDMADGMYTAQASRLGYTTLSASYRSLAGMASSLFIRSYKRTQDLYAALESRGYDGEIHVLERRYDVSPWKYAAVIAWVCTLITAAMVLDHSMGGAR